MAVVWGTVEDHDGHINVRSQEGVGTTFELYFPVTREDRPASQVSLSLESMAGKGEQILVVDDMEAQREITASILQERGYQVATVSSGESAMVWLKEKRADLRILIMIVDPGIDGLEAYRRILQVHPGQKAIIASGFAEHERVREAQALGAGPYIRKPFTLENIGIAVKAALNP